MKIYHEQLYANKFENLSNMGKLLQKQLTKEMEKQSYSALIWDRICIKNQFKIIKLSQIKVTIIMII